MQTVELLANSEGSFVIVKTDTVDYVLNNSNGYLTFHKSCTLALHKEVSERTISIYEPSTENGGLH